MAVTALPEGLPLRVHIVTTEIRHVIQQVVYQLHLPAACAGILREEWTRLAWDNPPPKADLRIVLLKTLLPHLKSLAVATTQRLQQQAVRRVISRLSKVHLSKLASLRRLLLAAGLRLAKSPRQQRHRLVVAWAQFAVVRSSNSSSSNHNSRKRVRIKG